MNKKKVLGKGIHALIPEGSGEGEKFFFIGIEKLRPNRSQPRKSIDTDKLSSLAASIKEKGILQPLLVRPSMEGYEIVAGERRWRAAQEAGLSEVPVVVQEFGERESLEAALVENLQRENLNPIEEALAYVELMKHWDMTQETLAARLGRNRSTIANTVRLLQLSPKVQQLVGQNKLSAGHARALLALSDFGDQELLAREVIEKGLSVRDVERLVKKVHTARETQEPKSPDPFVQDILDKLERSLGTKVKISMKGKRGSIHISFFNLDELDGLIKKICG
jgi:ParB family chromosome partitioning protein